MHFFNQRTGKYTLALTTGLLLALQPVWAAGPPSPSPFSNPLALVMMALMALLLLVIGILSNILTGAASIKLKKKLQEKKGAATLLLLPLLLTASAAFAQGTTPAEAPAPKVIGGLPASTFYVMVAIIFLELLVIIGLLINIKFLLKAEKEKLAPEAEAELKPEAVQEAKKHQLNWWDRFNKLKPLSQESELDLGHEYDGIRELNNRLPPWWLYGFYLTIIFAVIYLWRFHVSHTGPSSKEEYERSVARAEARVQEYLKAKGENVNENTVTFLNNETDLTAGKDIFLRPGFCNSCHGTDGSGLVNGAPGVGPNLTDAYWLNGGGSIQDIFKVIKYGGRPNKGMQSWESQLSAKQMAQVASYVKSLTGSKPAKAKDPEPDAKLYEEKTAPAAPAADSAAAKGNPVTMNK